MESPQLSEPSKLIGSRVRKYFRHSGWADGTVDSFCETSAFFHVTYADEDEEELSLKELQEIIRSEDMECQDAPPLDPAPEVS